MNSWGGSGAAIPRSPLPSPPSGLRCPFLPGVLAVSKWSFMAGGIFCPPTDRGCRGRGLMSPRVEWCSALHGELGWRPRPNRTHLHINPSEVAANLQRIKYKGYLPSKGCGGFQGSHLPVPHRDRPGKVATGPGTCGEPPGRAFPAPSSNHTCQKKTQPESLFWLQKWPFRTTAPERSIY